MSMATLVFSSVLFLLFLATISPSAARRNPSGSNIVHEVCKASRDPSSCEASMSKVPSGATVLEAIQSAIKISSHNVSSGRAMVEGILAASNANLSRSNAAKTCLELLNYSKYRTNLAADALPRGKNKDARAWMSAALEYQYDCWSELKSVNDTSLISKTMTFFSSYVIRSSSNALGMMLNYDVFGEETASWGSPKTERDGFWEFGRSKSSESRSVGGVPPTMKAVVTVCSGGNGCDYSSVQQAVNAAPDNAESGNNFVIWIKAGVYEETVRVPKEKKNVVFLGDGMGKTVITGSMNVEQPGTSTFHTATVAVVGDGFMARGLTFQNTAGPNAHQAVAFRSDSDLSIIESCEFIGNQDTLNAHSLRQFYKSCRIQGNIDFIFGNSAAFFQDCLILITPIQVKPKKSETNIVTAHGRTDPAQSTGFVFQDCVINGTDAYIAISHTKANVQKNFLGRPWKEYSRTVFIHCTLEVLIRPEGWIPWNGGFALKTLYYGEFENKGSGSNTSKRVSWSKQIPQEYVHSYSLQNFIQGDEWIPTW